MSPAAGPCWINGPAGLVIMGEAGVTGGRVIGEEIEGRRERERERREGIDRECEGTPELGAETRSIEAK